MRRFQSARTLATTALLAALAAEAIGQVAIPYVPPELYQERRRLQENKITVCVWEISPTTEIDSEIAKEIGRALLIEVDIYRYKSMVPLSQMFWETVFIQLAEHCDAIMGFVLETEVYPDWLTVTRPYYEGPLLLAVTEPAYRSLADIPRGRVIGSILYTPSDYRLVAYLESLPAGERWVRFPFTSANALLGMLERGTVAAGIFWAPTLVELTGGDPAARGVRVIPLDPLPTDSTPVGMILREYNSNLRVQLDVAIAALIEDGVIGDILERHNLQPF